MLYVGLDLRRKRLDWHALAGEGGDSVLVLLRRFDDRIVAMCGRGMSVRDIQADLRELYGSRSATT